jgi:hypothetical protein
LDTRKNSVEHNGFKWYRLSPPTNHPVVRPEPE